MLKKKEVNNEDTTMKFKPELCSAVVEIIEQILKQVPTSEPLPGFEVLF